MCSWEPKALESWQVCAIWSNQATPTLLPLDCFYRQCTPTWMGAHSLCITSGVFLSCIMWGEQVRSIRGNFLLFLCLSNSELWSLVRQNQCASLKPWGFMLEIFGYLWLSIRIHVHACMDCQESYANAITDDWSITFACVVPVLLITVYAFMLIILTLGLPTQIDDHLGAVRQIVMSPDKKKRKLNDIANWRL